jgi:hypothetical protein
MRPRASLTALIVTAGVAVAAPSALADKITATIQPDAAGQGTYAGKVKAKRDKCVKGRTVEVYDLSQGGYLIGATRTDAKGNWELFEYVPDPGQQVRIAVPAKTKGRGICSAVSTIAEVPESVVIPQSSRR